MAVLDKVTDFLFFLGKLLIVGSVGKCCVLEVSPWGIQRPSPLVLSQKLFWGHPSHEAAPFHPVFHPVHRRNPRLLLLHPADKAGPGHGAAPQLLLGPHSGELPSLSGVTLGGEHRDAPHQPLPTPGASRTPLLEVFSLSSVQ